MRILEDWRPTVAHAGHIVVATVAGLGLVGGTVRSSQDADLLISLPQPMSTVALIALKNGGKRPFGFDVVGGSLVPNADEQAALARGRALRDEGKSYRDICRGLDIRTWDA